MDELFDEGSMSPPRVPQTSETITLPEVGFAQMIRLGMLALQLLPENSSAGKRSHYHINIS